MNAIHSKTKTMPNLIRQEILKRSAYHAAGYAASIYLGNERKGLSPVFFRIVKAPLKNESSVVRYIHGDQDNLIAKVEGGRLIDTLPYPPAETSGNVAGGQEIFYEKAFDADIANILAGPLAEAKYVAHRDDETITARLVNLKALTSYNGASEVDLVSRYFECINLPADEKERKIVNIYFDTFSFLSEYGNWAAISRLADHILSSDKAVIEADEAIRVMENVAR